MYNVQFNLDQNRGEVALGKERPGVQTRPGRMYPAPNANFYYKGDAWAGLEAGTDSKSRRQNILTVVEAVTGLAAAGGLVYAHRKKDVGWYCSILASLMWAGIGAHTARWLAGLIWDAAAPIKEG